MPQSIHTTYFGKWSADIMHTKNMHTLSMLNSPHCTKTQIHVRCLERMQKRRLLAGVRNFGTWMNKSNLSVYYLSLSLSLYSALKRFFYSGEEDYAFVSCHSSPIGWLDWTKHFQTEKKNAQRKQKKKRQNSVPHHKSRFSTKPDPLSSSHAHRHQPKMYELYAYAPFHSERQIKGKRARERGRGGETEQVKG